MKIPILKRAVQILIPAVLGMNLLSACSLFKSAGNSGTNEPETADAYAGYVRSIEDEPDTVDFQCTTIYYTIATNVFNRLVEMENDRKGDVVIRPSLAKSWEISEDGRVYHFHLRENIKFSNDSPLTSEDVEYTFTRLMSHPDSANTDVGEMILGAKALAEGKAERLEGFEVVNDLDFDITLEQPFSAFLACLSMPGASILDKETTEKAGDRFGKDPAWTIGTGSFILTDWTPGKGMKLKANKDCWAGAPASEGLDLLFMTDPEEIRVLFEEGGLDVVNLEDVGNSAEYFMHGEAYQNRLHEVQRIAITYIALNESVPSLQDVRVRKALQMSLNRSVLLEAVYSGRGNVENGIFPVGLYGHNPDLPEIPYDPEGAAALLEEAGVPEGFAFDVYVKNSSTRSELNLLKLAAEMWEKIGIHASIQVISEDEFMAKRKRGELDCYSAMWTADFNDPDNFIYTFFGNKANTVNRSLCYPREDIMKRVQDARGILDSNERIAEYQELEKIIIQDDAAWIPLFTRRHYYITSERLKGFSCDWMGSVKNRYRLMAVSSGTPSENTQ